MALSRRNVGSQVSKICEASEYVRNLEVGNHGIFFYRNPHEKREVLFNFLQAGLEKGEAAVYIAAQETSRQIRRHMEDFGLDVESLDRDGLLQVFDCDEWYMIDGEVDIPRLQNVGQYIFEETMEIGLKGLRGCGETACFFEHEKEKELVEYELTIGRKFDLPMTALCAYDMNHAKSLEDKFFFSLIKAHGPVVTSSFAQEVKFRNLFPTILDDVLETIFGHIGKEAILGILYERHLLTPRNIVEDPAAFLQGLEELFGSGAQPIVKSLAAQMHSTMGIIPTKMGLQVRNAWMQKWEKSFKS